MKNLWEAEVIDNNDPDKAGRVKIKIPTLHARVDNDNLPWAKQKSLFSGGSDSYGSSTIPEIGSLVWVQFDNDKDYLKPFYVADIHLNNFHPHSLFEDNVKSSITGFSSSYPDVKYHYYKNGNCVGVSSNASTPEIFIFHKSGTNIFIDANGKIFVTGKSDIEVKDNTNNKITMDATGITLYTADGSLWKPNCLTSCLFTGSPHTLTTTIKGANS